MGGRGASSGAGGKKSKDLHPEISALGENKFSVGFTRENLDKHWTGGSSDHSAEYKGMTKEQYADRALSLIQSAADGKQILGYKTPGGVVVRFDVSTGDFVKGSPETGIATMFKPNDGSRYFHRRFSREEGIK